MNHDLWNVNDRHSRISKFLPELLKDRIVQCAVLLLFIVCINWQLSERMDDLQYYLLFQYLSAHIEMFLGFNELTDITISLPDGNADITRIGITTHHYFTGAWSRYRDALTWGFGIAFFFTALAVAYSIANKSLEKWALKQQQALDEIDRQIAFEKEQEKYRPKKPKPQSATPPKPVEKDLCNDFGLPEVELLTELIDELEDDVWILEYEPEEHIEEQPIVKPMRQPGRIYRDDD